MKPAAFSNRISIRILIRVLVRNFFKNSAAIWLCWQEKCIICLQKTMQLEYVLPEFWLEFLLEFFLEFSLEFWSNSCWNSGQILIRILIRILLGILMTNSIELFSEFSSEILFEFMNSGLKSNWLHLIGLGMAGGLFGASWTPALRGYKTILPA